MIDHASNPVATFLADHPELGERPSYATNIDVAKQYAARNTTMRISSYVIAITWLFLFLVVVDVIHGETIKRWVDENFFLEFFFHYAPGHLYKLGA